MQTVMGLDFGTTNSALALWENGVVRVVGINNITSNERTLRSVLLMNKRREDFVGQRAVLEYLKSNGKLCRFLQSLKTFLPDKGFTGTTIYNKHFEIEDLIAIILKEIKYLGEQHSGYNIDTVVMGRPALFSKDAISDKLAENRLRVAAIRAGFREVSFEFEPIAATLAYTKRMSTNAEETVLMGDFGGGTSDFTVMRIQAGMPMTQDEKSKRILSMNGVYVGGDMFDSRIMWEKGTPHFGRHISTEDMIGQSLSMPLWIMHTLCEWHAIPFLREQSTKDAIREMKRTTKTPRFVENLEYLIRENKGFSLFQAIERAKVELSNSTDTVISYHDDFIHIEEPISRSEFEAFIAKDLATISACVTKTLSEAGTTKEQIDRVLLTGGSSFIPAVRRIFAEMFGESKIINLDAFTSVAHGLAISTSFR